ncbi:glycosyltransferase family 4 protein [Rugosimonospora africana]|uniref:Glycosyl transferase n=1 Tax=Rugosimonospora africana TaxID=556532 RepID=A0A8J3QSV5_9ACTN|nr:glycosyltransferase family 4 protein [Rugosimonospora africana]GIH15824.1 glycosyl transferase [Rugosimonospora africana]
MRIGLISTPWTPLPPPAYGGLEAVVDHLARGFAAAGHEVLVAATEDSTCPVPLVPGCPPADPGGTWLTEAELAQVVRAYRAMDGMDVIHDHTLAGPLCLLRPPGVPVVTTNHGPYRAPLLDIYRAMDRHAAIVAISHHQASTAEGVRIARVIHHGIDVEAIPVGDGTGGYFCFLGRMSPRKGVREAALVAREAGVPLRIAAKIQDGTEREYFDDAVAPLLGGDVEYVGELAATEKYALLGGATALLNPVQWPEPFGLVMIEALATGTPVVATASGAAPELIDDGVTGYLRGDIAGLAACLPRTRDLDRRRCREEARRRFAADRMVAEHLDLYAELLQARRARPIRR